MSTFLNLSALPLQRVNDCMVSIQLYASAEDIKQGPPQQSAVYTKADCSPPQVD